MYSTHHANCTPPREPVNFVYSPNTRETLDILWSSFFTLFICTWTVQHLNIPRQRGKPPKSLREKVTSWWNSKPPKLKWMTITLLVPESLVGRSAVEWMAARKQTKNMQDLRKDGQEWTLTHTFFANMGGFVLEVQPDMEAERSESSKYRQCSRLSALGPILSLSQPSEPSFAVHSVGIPKQSHMSAIHLHYTSMPHNWIGFAGTLTPRLRFRQSAKLNSTI